MILFNISLSGCVITYTGTPCRYKDKIGSRVRQLKLFDSLSTIPPLPKIVPLDKNKKLYEIDKLNSNNFNYDWISIIEPIVNKILQAGIIDLNNLILLDDITNCTSVSLNTNEIYKILHSILINRYHFNLVSNQQLLVTKKNLGLSLKDSLSTRNKAIIIARNVCAHYIVCFSIIGNVDLLILQMQMMLVKTGEIIVSSKNFIKK